MCNKIKFTKREAFSALKERKKKGKKWAKECRCYECPICIENKEQKVWHLTSIDEFEEKIPLKLEELIFSSNWEKLTE